LYGWGSTKYSRFGILGEEVIPPKLIPLKTAVKFISAGNWHSMFIDNIGKLYSAGHNKQGACGSGTFENI
jgi:alpha-tubulin suppressor-like RCC1 family protein